MLGRTARFRHNKKISLARKGQPGVELAYVERFIRRVDSYFGRLDQAELDREAPLFVYCRSGARSGQACSILRERGYDATNIGGILHYEGTLEQGGQQV